MAEAWSIDYIDFDKGIVGLHWALDVSGPLTAGGGSKYVLLNIPNVPDALWRNQSQNMSCGKQISSSQPQTVVSSQFSSASNPSVARLLLLKIKE